MVRFTLLLTYAAPILLQLHSAFADVGDLPDLKVGSWLEDTDVIIDIYPHEGPKFTMHERVDRRRLSIHQVLEPVPLQKFQTQTNVKGVHFVYGPERLLCRLHSRMDELDSEEFGVSRLWINFQNPVWDVTTLICAMSGVNNENENDARKEELEEEEEEKEEEMPVLIQVANDRS